MSEKKSSRVLLYVGVGCLGLTGLCCLGIGGAAFARKSSYDSGAREHADLFLARVQTRDWAGAFAATEYMGGSGLYAADQFQRCVESTVLADMTSYECDDVSSEVLADDGADVTCSIVSASHGTNEITVHVNSPDDTPYLGFIWFSPGAYMGEAWHGDGCTRWSGREFFREPPAGRVRP